MLKIATKVLRVYGDCIPKYYCEYYTPWVYEVDIEGCIVDEHKVGGFKGGALVVENPVHGQVYAYGQGKCLTKCFYVIFLDGEFKLCDNIGLILDVWAMDERYAKEHAKLMG